MAISEKKYALKDLYIGMTVKAEQLSEIYNKYMILLFDDTESKTGKLVFCGDIQNQEYDSWFMQPNRMKSIGQRAFTGCTRLKEVYLPYSVVKIGDAAFEDCRIIYCEMMNPPEYWYNEKEEERESEDYAMYVYADYNQWCGDWGDIRL